MGAARALSGFADAGLLLCAMFPKLEIHFVLSCPENEGYRILGSVAGTFSSGNFNVEARINTNSTPDLVPKW